MFIYTVKYIDDIEMKQSSGNNLDSLYYLDANPTRREIW